MTRVFVYGTLKRGCGNHHLIASQQFIGPARTPAGFTLFSLGDYPGMVRAPGDTAGVSGELWTVDAGCLLRLDKLEGVAEGLYERVAITLAPPFADQPAETYLYLHDLGGRKPLGPEWSV
jgi:gamma-glutamylcyclotransferase (GGCT)/AIG2-like uncharacterized protein YtfP